MANARQNKKPAAAEKNLVDLSPPSMDHVAQTFSSFGDAELRALINNAVAERKRRRGARATELPAVGRRVKLLAGPKALVGSEGRVAHHMSTKAIVELEDGRVLALRSAEIEVVP